MSYSYEICKGISCAEQTRCQDDKFIMRSHQRGVCIFLLGCVSTWNMLKGAKEHSLSYQICTFMSSPLDINSNLRAPDSLGYSHWSAIISERQPLKVLFFWQMMGLNQVFYIWLLLWVFKGRTLATSSDLQALYTFTLSLREFSSSPHCMPTFRLNTYIASAI